MPDSSPIVKARLKGAVHARFQAECEARKLSESELLRLALNQFESSRDRAEQAGTVPAHVRQSVEPDRAASALERKTVWMPGLLMRAALDRADAQGMSFSRWISSLVQANVMHAPMLTERELLALEAANW